ncbi:MAG: 2,3-bisphosphoglycerate-independent phosphoglycerate mutase [Nitrospirae bacterium]|nr:2,3-bisphosphoglycerate-independent phosphoglycerate mutase [Nitrospirota bacterium]
MDGLGDIPSREHPATPLEAARTPHLDELAREASLGRLLPVGPGITPGSGPGHLALFGYDPIGVQIGRGVLEAVGLDMKLEAGDVAARGNFCTLDPSGIVTDRRAGRIETEKTRVLCARIQTECERLDGVKVVIQPGMSHRFAIVFRGKGLSDEVTDMDPQKEGRAIPPARPLAAGAARTARAANLFSRRVQALLKGESRANAALLRGFSKRPDLPSLTDRFRLKAACVASYPMYRGLARLLGMEILDVTPGGLDGQCVALDRNRDRYTFFYFHWKATDQAGEDGNFEAKVRAIETLDGALPRILEWKPDVVAVTGDHSSPVPLKAHSWHPVPALIWSRWGGGDGQGRFSERTCNSGSLGIFAMKDLMPLLLANALKLKKFGA